MKAIILAVISALSLSAFAGPEEHYAAQTCYYLQPGSEVLLPDTPSQICLETIAFDLTQGRVSVFSYFQASLFKNLTVTYLARHNEDGHSFRAADLLQSAPLEGCDRSSRSVLSIAGRTDNAGAVDVTFLNIEIEQTYQCNSVQKSSVLTYKIQ